MVTDDAATTTPGGGVILYGLCATAGGDGSREVSRTMSERTRIIAWWGYVICVVVIFEVVFQVSGFGPALIAALASIAILGSALKFVIGRLTRRPQRRQPDEITNDAG